jgi:hypothetical protein
LKEKNAHLCIVCTIHVHFYLPISKFVVGFKLQQINFVLLFSKYDLISIFV